VPGPSYSGVALKKVKEEALASNFSISSPEEEEEVLRGGKRSSRSSRRQ